MSQPEDLARAPAGEPGSPSPELLDRARELLSHIELINVRPCAIHTELAEGVPAGVTPATITFDVDLAFAADESVYGNRFDYRFELLSEAGDEEEPETIATLNFSLLVDYRVDEGYTPSLDAAEYVAGSTGYFAAYPYARELLQSLFSRLQVDPIVLGLINRGRLRPGSIGVLSSLTADDASESSGNGLEFGRRRR